MTALTKRINIIKAVASATYKEWAAYRTHSLVSVFVGPVFFFVQVFIWRSVYADGDVINGMSLRQMLVYSGTAALIGYLTMDFADWNLQMLIRTGKFLTFMLRPIHHRFFALSQKIGHRILGFIFEFVPVYLIFMFVFKINLVPQSFFWAAASIALGFLMTFYLNYCIGIAGFWLTRTDGIRGVYSLFANIFSGALIPLVFFPRAFQRVLMFLPFQFTTYVPVRVFMGSYVLADRAYSIPTVVGLQLVAVIAVAVFSELLYKLAIKHFSGVGA